MYACYNKEVDYYNYRKGGRGGVGGESSIVADSITLLFYGSFPVI